MKLEAGKFYRSRNGRVWCCYCVDPNGPIQAQAYCIPVRSRGGAVEYFFLDGRYDEGGNRDLCLEAECFPMAKLLELHSQGVLSDNELVYHAIAAAHFESVPGVREQLPKGLEENFDKSLPEYFD